ncbi:MAG: homocysteine S-methyltransferase family protein [Treponema sp.]|jgi:5-methyltetrahydrofolate--homocysteine methyltransferase|nr:homocysteine S-methyltransferase family protein [Treponema sp.]
MSVREQLNSIAEKRIIILDGGMGSLIQSLHLNERDFRGSEFAKHPTPLEGCNDLLCLTRPAAISTIHDAYLDAGADIIETCSFNATSISLSDYGIGNLAYDISAAAARIARKSADKYSAIGKQRFVAGSIGPTAKGASLYPDINDPGRRSICWDELEAAYYDNARGLLDGGVDIFVIETVFDTLNAKAAFFAVSRLMEERQIDVPIMISAAISGESGQLLSGQSIEAFCASLVYVKPWAFALNCSFNAQKLFPFVRRLSEAAPCLAGAYPNAGLPNAFGRYEETAEIMSANIEEYFKEGLVNIIGGCCGSTPAHIVAIAKKAQSYKPRKFPDNPRRGFFAGLQPLCIADNAVNFNNAANSAFKTDFSKYIGEGSYEDAVDTVRDYVDDGAQVVSIEIDDERAMGKFLDFALMNPYAAKVPFFIKSANFNVLEAGLKRLQGRGFAGHLNLKDGDDEFIRRARLVLRYGAAAVVNLIDEKGQAETFERKLEIAQRVYQLLQKNGYPPENIVFDTLAPPEDAIHSWIRDNCPGVLICA